MSTIETFEGSFGVYLIVPCSHDIAQLLIDVIQKHFYGRPQTLGFLINQIKGNVCCFTYLLDHNFG